MSPWGETDPIPLQGINPRLPDLRGTRVGLFANYKRAAEPIQDAVEAELRRRYGSDITISRLHLTESGEAAMGEDGGKRYAEWLEKEVDSVIVAVGD
jgi:hypothetical protein